MSSNPTDNSNPASNPLPTPNRHITALALSPTDPKTSTFSTLLPAALPIISSLGGGHQRIAYQIPSPPINFTPGNKSGDDDITAYAATLNNSHTSLPSLVPAAAGAANVWYNDLPPGAEGTMHATRSVDFVVVVAGTVELVLQSSEGDGEGERRTLRVGDCVVQRGVGHRWRNASGTEWARVVAFAVKAEVEG